VGGPAAPVTAVGGALVGSGTGAYYGAQHGRGTGLNLAGQIGRFIDARREHKPTEKDLAVRNGIITKADGTQTNYGHRDAWDYLNAIPGTGIGTKVTKPAVRAFGEGVAEHHAKVQGAKVAPRRADYTIYTHPNAKYYSPEAQEAIARGELHPEMIQGKTHFTNTSEKIYPGSPHTFSNTEDIYHSNIMRDVADQEHVNPAFNHKFNPSEIYYDPIGVTNPYYPIASSADTLNQRIKDNKGLHQLSVHMADPRLQASGVRFHELGHNAASKAERDLIYDPSLQSHYEEPGYMVNTHSFENAANEMAVRAIKEEVKAGLRPTSDLQKIVNVDFHGRSDYFPADAKYSDDVINEIIDGLKHEGDRLKTLNLLGQKAHALVTNTTDVGYQSAFPRYTNLRRALNFPFAGKREASPLKELTNNDVRAPYLAALMTMASAPHFYWATPLAVDASKAMINSGKHTTQDGSKPEPLPPRKN
jgi:hypothetical protein